MGMDLKKAIGRRLQLLRIEKNLTQEHMGEMLNLSTSAYCKIEYGETDLTLTRINKIAEIFGIPTIELLEKIFDKTRCSINVPQTDLTQTDSNQLRHEDLCEMILSNSRLIKILERRIEALEQLFKDAN